ncbi:very-long-chain 3-oxoacyl-CoA reductase-like protein At1g24470 [Rhodamnia argentea]|uniref:Very-long-chain 3-oxoacyl-CoA reductase-like protein At1g24470 n=1 Tax=Rhodamnia argentea TaxID=178133 RepID=A0A8B8NZM0_9MYRT|nr:very-long-chain 3-oxoacyl-CoA reductase-like protein At1g24470 [Rhodamnia argentea]
MNLACMNHPHENKAQYPWIFLLSSLGFIVLLKHTLSFLQWVHSTFLRPSKDLVKYGPWALVTGCTNGIGRALAFRLAQRGLNLVLVSRNHEKLKTVSHEIETNFLGIQTRIVAVDFSKDASSCIWSIEEAIRGLDIGVLINNVGITYPRACFFHEVEERVWREIVRVNVEGTARATRVVVPGMVQRRRGAVVSIGSGAATVVPSHPLFTSYAATKAFIDRLSRSLHVEYKLYGVDFLCQVPLYVATRMASKVASIEGESVYVPSPDKYARAAIDHIGYEPQCTPHWAHSLQWCFARSVPNRVLDAWRLSIGLKRREKNIKRTSP